MYELSNDHGIEKQTALYIPDHPALGPLAVPLQAILLDAHGVIIDDTSIWNEWTERVINIFQEKQKDISRSTVLSALQRAMRDWELFPSEILIRQFGGDDTMLQRSWAGLQAKDVFTGAREDLLYLRKKAPLALVTNEHTGFRQQLAEAELLDIFDAIVISQEYGNAKPDLSIFLEALRLLNADSIHSMMIGDRLDCDIVPARKLGMLTVRICQGPFRWQEPKDETSLPHLAVSSLATLVQQFENLLKG